MTARGERVALDARESLAEIELRLAERIGADAVDRLRGALGQDRGPVLGTAED